MVLSKEIREAGLGLILVVSGCQTCHGEWDEIIATCNKNFLIFDGHVMRGSWRGFDGLIVGLRHRIKVETSNM